jgi:uncharacterized membrane protein
MNALRHLVWPRAMLGRRFPAETLTAIETAVRESELRHRGEIRFAIEVTLDWQSLKRVATVRERALEVFAELHVWDTAERNGVLIYVLLAERGVEVVADRGFDGRVSRAEWRAVCERIEAEFGANRWQAGALAGIAAATELLERAFPLAGQEPRNEQPDRPSLL